MEKKLYRSKTERKLAGVCGGLAEYFNMDVSLMRLITVLVALFSIGVLAYIVAALVIPEKPDEIPAVE